MPGGVGGVASRGVPLSRSSAQSRRQPGRWRAVRERFGARDDSRRTRRPTKDRPMNVADEHSTSCWMEDAPTISASPLDGNQTCDVVVIGSGIAGLSVAFELSRFGRTVIVIDRGAIGRGMTARTTAHLATELDDFYSELIRTRGEEEARLYYGSQVAAVNRIEAICREEGIDADFARIDGFLFPALLEDRAALEEEYRACRKIGF